MIVLKRFMEKDLTDRGCVEFIAYSHTQECSQFRNRLCGNAGDEESAGLIRACKQAELVEEEEDAMVMSCKTTCPQACSSGVRYGLTVINNSKEGLYTEIGNVGKKVWEYLAGLDREILLGWHPGSKYSIEGKFPVIVRDYRLVGVVQDVIDLRSATEDMISDKYKKLKQVRMAGRFYTQWYDRINDWEWAFTEKYSLNHGIEPMELVQPVAAFDSFREFQKYLLRKWPAYELNLLPAGVNHGKNIRVNSYLTHLKDDASNGHTVYVLDMLMDGNISLRAEELTGNVLFDLYTKAGILWDLPKEIKSRESIFVVTNNNDFIDVLFGGRIVYEEEEILLELFQAEYIVYSFACQLSRGLDDKKLQVMIYDLGLPKRNLHSLTPTESKWCEWL